MGYVDGFVIAVPNSNRDRFRDHAMAVIPVFKEFGAIRIVECWGDDVPDGEVTSFPMSVKRKDDESVVFSWIEWPDKATRDHAMAEMVKDPRFDPAVTPVPFDGKRMIFGGFEPIVDE